MQIRNYKKPLITAGMAAAGVVLGFAVLPLVLPFLLAYLLALGAEPAVAALGRRSALPRWLRSGICVTGLFAVAGLLLWFFGRVLWEELLRLVGELPELLRRLQPALEELRRGLENLVRKAPELKQMCLLL